MADVELTRLASVAPHVAGKEVGSAQAESAHRVARVEVVHNSSLIAGFA